AEVPALFHMEALRAQAVAARTYAIYSMASIGMDHFDHARISEIWQAYLSESEMRARWGDNFDTHFAAIHEAVRSTKGEILVYDNEPILAVFHAQSGGQTEYSENVWRAPRPYLQSVNSNFYTYRPDFEYNHKFSTAELNTRLNSAFPNMLSDSNAPQIQINARTAAGYVQSVTIAGHPIDAIALRTALGLRSTNFTIRHENNHTIFTTRGHGHGVGMSQIGANALARRGYSYVEILAHYYRGAMVVGKD
ncbi:MAG: stage II sporulation protein D, partial [Bacteroidales bacterium]|nr:stage II sporulation protein D [Bacteroidales bacterium]